MGRQSVAAGRMREAVGNPVPGSAADGLHGLPALIARLLVALALCLAPRLAAQTTIDDLRNELRRALDPGAFAQLQASMLLLTLDPSFSGASFTVPHSGNVGDSDYTTYKLPFQRDIPMEGTDGALYLEGGLGLIQSEVDLTIDLSPNPPAVVEMTFEGWGGLIGAGWRQELGSGFAIRPSLFGTLGRIENRASYNAMGAAVIKPLADGIVFNWSASTAGLGAAVTLLHEDTFGEVRTAFALRYNWQHVETFDATDPVQEASTDLQLLIARWQVDGPLGFEIAGAPLRWVGIAGASSFIDHAGEAIGFDSWFEIGGGISADLSPLSLPLGGLELTGSLLWGEDIRGWTFGLAVDF